LIPNWPFGAVILAAGLIVFLSRLRTRYPRTAIDLKMLVFTVLFMGVSIYAQSSTTNLNSGATTGIARYALWYLPLFFPLIVKSLGFASKSMKLLIPLLSVATALSLMSTYSNFPTLPESYTSPSLASQFIQSNAPWAYNPPPEIFAERYSGVGEGVHKSMPRAVFGPDCKKVLVFAGPERTAIFAPPDCVFGKTDLRTIEIFALSIEDSSPKYFYMN